MDFLLLIFICVSFLLGSCSFIMLLGIYRFYSYYKNQRYTKTLESFSK